MVQEDGKKQRRSGHETHQNALSAVERELSKRGYKVVLTRGNLTVTSPKGITFLLDVKGQYKGNFWPVAQKRITDGLFYVLAFVPDPFVPDDPRNQFFILTQEQVNTGIRIDSDHARALGKAKGLGGEPGDVPGIQQKFAQDFKSLWEALPQ
jgi:hypothetical protein